MRTTRLILGFAVFAGLALAGGVALAWRPAIAPIAAPPRTAFAPEVVATRRRAGRDRGLLGLPRRRARPRLCRRAGAADAVRHGLRHQHHPRSGHRHRTLVGGRVPPRHARRHRPHRPAPLPGPALPALHPRDRPGHRGAVRLPDDPRAGACHHAAQPAALPVERARDTGRLEPAVPAPGGLAAPTRRSRRSGTAAPTWSTRSGTAAPAIRRTTRWARRRPARRWTAAWPRAGRRTR